jgi:hypothetical protein
MSPCFFASSSDCSPQARDTHTWHSDPADGARLHELDDAAVVVAGVDLRAHLRRDAGLCRRLADHARLLNVVVSGFSQNTCFFSCSAGSVATACVCSGVLTTTASNSPGWSNTRRRSTTVRAWGRGGRLGEVPPVHVAEDGDVLGGDGAQVLGAPAAATDDGHPQLVAARLARERLARRPRRRPEPPARHR